MRSTHWSSRPAAPSWRPAVSTGRGACLEGGVRGRLAGGGDAHGGGGRARAFAPDGPRLLSGGADSTAIVWHVDLPAARKAWDKSTLDRLWMALAADASVAYPAIAA